MKFPILNLEFQAPIKIQCVHELGLTRCVNLGRFAQLSPGVPPTIKKSYFSKMSIFRDFPDIRHHALTFWGPPREKTIRSEKKLHFCVWKKKGGHSLGSKSQNDSNLKKNRVGGDLK